jgi:hypothetical protein
MNRNKQTKRAVVAFCVVAVLLTLAGCKKKTPASQSIEETAIVPGEPMVIELGVSIGLLRFGMTKDEVIKHLGQPDKILGEGTELNYVSSRGLSFTVDDELGMQQIKCWSDNFMTKLPFVVTTFSGRTKEGIGMGADREKIIAAYGQPDRTRTNQKGEFENLYYDELRAKFVLRQNELVAMILDAPK